MQATLNVIVTSTADHDLAITLGEITTLQISAVLCEFSTYMKPLPGTCQGCHALPGADHYGSQPPRLPPSKQADPHPRPNHGSQPFSASYFPMTPRAVLRKGGQRPPLLPTIPPVCPGLPCVWRTWPSHGCVSPTGQPLVSKLADLLHLQTMSATPRANCACSRTPQWVRTARAASRQPSRPTRSLLPPTTR